MRSLVVVSAGISSPSSTTQLAEEFGETLRTTVGGRGESLQVTTIELRQHAVAMAHAMTTGGILSKELEEAVELLRNADGLVIVTPIFQASFAGLLKMFLDLMDKELLRGTPVAIAATGGSPRHSLALDYALRPVLVAMHANVVPTTVFAATEDFGTSAGAVFTQRIGQAAAEMADLIVATEGSVGGLGQNASTLRRKVNLAQDYTPFGDLLKGMGQ